MNNMLEKQPSSEIAELLDEISVEEILQRIEVLNNIGVALSSDQNINHLLESILLAAMSMTNADGGTIYRVSQNTVTFEIIRNRTLGLSMGGTSQNAINLPPIALYDENGQPNNAMVVAYAVLQDKTVNISDVYKEQDFDFSGTRKFDQVTGYHSQSFLTIPMVNHENAIIGVLQLLNAHERHSNIVIPFSLVDQRFVESLASQAAVTLTNRLLVEQLRSLFFSFIKMINQAIDEKSPHTSGHCQRVPALTLMLAEAVHDTDTGMFTNFNMTENDRRELELAGLLHDCGKITTPVHVIDKSSKLETIFDRITLIASKFEIVKRDAKINCLEASFALPEKSADYQHEYNQKIVQINADLDFLRHANIGSESMTDADIARVQDIAKKYTIADEKGCDQPVLTDDEINNLTIRAGTLTTAERHIINRHIEITIQMLESLPWPRDFKNVTEYAGGHHERMDGKGYPKGLTRDQMSIQARVMGIADIFEALTAGDRPYKKAKTLSESLKILGNMAKNGHIDPDIFDIFIRKQVYMQYANAFLDKKQIDDVQLEKIPGYCHEK
jgi:HD-GYP domain-containing protein (c-di-GMP phosphodiesterase class II)